MDIGRQLQAVALSATLFLLLFLPVLWLCPPAESQETVHPRTGQLSLSAVDLAISSGPVAVEIRRTLLPVVSLPGPFGTHWGLNLNKSLIRTDKGVMISEDSGPVLFSKKALSAIYASVAGDELTFEKDGRAVRRLLDGSREVYSDAGNLAELDFRNGNRFFFTYGSAARLERIEDGRGNLLRFTSDPEGRLVRIDGSEGSSVTYQYTGRLLTEVRINGGPAVRYGYDGDGRLVRVDDPQRGTVTITYDARGRVVGRAWADGSRESCDYSADGKTLRRNDPAGNATITRWSGDGLREEITDALGQRSVIESDENGRVRAVTGPTGLTTRMDYDSLDRIAAVTGPRGDTTRFEYLGNTNYTSAILYADGTRQRVEYDANFNVLAVREGNDIVGSFSYTGDGMIAAWSGEGVPETRFAYDAAGRLVTKTNALGETTRFEYDRRGNIVRTTTATGAVSEFTYNAQGMLTAVKDPAGGVTRLAYDERTGLLVSAAGPAGGVTRYEYDALGRITGVTDPAGRVTRRRFDARGLVIALSLPGGGLYQYQYDAAGRLVAQTNPLGGVTRYLRDALGRPHTITDPAGRMWKYEYTADGLVAKVTGPAGDETRYGYDTRGKMTSMTDPLGRVARYERDGRDRISRVILPNGQTNAYSYDREGRLSGLDEGPGKALTFSYDPLGRLLQERGWKGAVVSYRYNAAGSLVSVKDGTSAGLEIRYDARGLVTSLTGPSGASTGYVYDASGRIVTIADPLGRKTQMSYGPADDLLEVRAPNGDRLKFRYDLSGQLGEVALLTGEKLSFEYDGMGNLRSIKDSDGHQTRYEYDESGLLTGAIDPQGSRTAFAYDLEGNLAAKRLPDGRAIQYRYDRRGSLTSVDDGSLAVHYEYDEDGRIRDISYPSLGKRLRYEYDRAGHLSRFTDAEGSVYDYEYGPDGELTAIRLPEGGEIRFRHDPLARRTIVEYPNGIKGIRDENAEGRATMIAYYDREEKLALGWRYAHDAAGNVVAVTDNAGKTSRYRYDASGQLLSEEGPKGKTSIAYFPGGNRKQVVKGNKTVLYRYDKVGKLVKAGSESFLYDARGNVVERKGPGGVTRYAFDAENRLVRVARPGGEDVTFGYSGTGERIWRRDKSGMTYFLTDGMNLVAELDGEMKVKASYLHAPGIDRPLVMRREGTTYYYHPRDLGTIAALTDSKGNVAATYDTDAFGGPTASAGRAFSPFLFTARELEADLGLYYCRDRYYDPSLGRFVSRDPILGEPPDPLSFPPYIYARNNPLSYSDPTGRGARYGGPWEHPRIFGQPGPMYLRPQVLDLIPRGDIKAWEWEYIKREHDYLVREGLGEADNYKRQLIARLNERTPAPSSRQSRLGNIYGRVKNAVVQAGAWAERKFNQIVRPEVYRNPTVQVNRSAAGSATGGGTVQANRPSTPPGPPRPGPAGSAPAGPAAPPRAPTPAQMAARTGAAVGAAAMGLDYWACREEGKSHEECLKELGRNMAIGTVISGGVVAAGGALGGAHALAAGGGVVAGALAGGAAVGTALAVTAPIVATVGAAAATVRLSEAIGNRPAVEAQERLHQFRQVNLEGLGVSLAALRDQMDRDLAALDGMRDAHSKLCADISSQVQRSWQTSTSISPVGISAKVEKIKKAAAGCTATDTPPGPADLQGIASRAKAQEDSVIRCVDSAGRLDCKTKEDADRVRQAYSACRQYLQQLENLEKTVRDRFRQQGSAGTGMSVIRPLLSEAEREFDTLVRLVDETSRIASELPGKVEKLKALQAGFDAKKAESFKRLKYLSESMPRRAPAADTEQAKRYAEAQELVFRSGAALDGRTLPACDLTKYSQYETAFISKGRLGGLFVEWKLEAERSMKEGRDAAAACEERENAVLRPITDSLSRARLALQNAEARVRDCTARASGQGPADGAPGSSGDGFGSAGEGTTEATASGSERAERSGTDGFGPGGIGQTTDRTGDLSLLGTDTGSTGSSTTVTGGGPGFGPAGSGRTDPVSPAPSWSPPLSHGDQIGARGQPVAPDAYRWYVMCDRANGTVVFGKDWDPARHVILAGPFEGPRTAQNWIGLNCPAARCNAQGACTAGAPYAAAAGGNWYVMCNRHDGTIVYGQHPDVSRQFILAGPLPGAQDATNWIAAVCPSARCTQTGACASGPVGGGNWYVLCNRDDGNVVMSKNVDPSRQIVWQGNLRGEWDARQWISMNCPSARCDRNGRCTQQAAPVPVPAKPPQPGPAIGQRPGGPSDFCNEQYRRFQDALRNNQARYANDILQASRGCWFYSDGTRALQQVQSKPPVQSKPQTAQLPGKPGPAVTPTPAPPKPAPACNRRAKCESWDARGRRWVLSTGYGGGFGREVEVGGACTAARQTRCWDDCDKRWRCYETR